MATSYEGRLGTAPEEAIKAPCVVAATSNITLSGEQTIGGVAVVAGDRVVVAGQTDATENGIYDAATGAWSRAKDWNDAQDVVTGQLVKVPGKLYEATFTGSFSPGTTSVTFTELVDFGASAKLDFITITQPVDLDAMESKLDFITITEPCDLDVVCDKVALITVTSAIDLDPIGTKLDQIVINGATTDMVTFDGATRYRHPSGLGAPADVTEFTFAAWMSQNDITSTPETYWSARTGTGAAYIPFIDANDVVDGRLNFQVSAAGGGTVLGYLDGVFVDNTAVHVILSADSNDVAKRHLIVDGVDRTADATWDTHNGGTLWPAGTGASYEHFLGGRDTANLNGCMGQLLIDDSYIDFSSAANVKLLYDNGAVAFGPDVFTAITGTNVLQLLDNDFTDWPTNDGTGGNWTLLTGGVTDCSLSIPGTGTQVGDVDLTILETKVNFLTVTQAVDLDAMESKLNFITITQAVDLDAMESKLNFITITQAVDLDAMESKLNFITITQAVDLDAMESKLNFITITQAVDLDAMETNVAALLAEDAFKDIPVVVDDDDRTFALTDNGKGIVKEAGVAATWTIPANASVAFPVGTVITLLNRDADAITLAITTDTLIAVGTGATGSVTIPQHSQVTVWKVATTVWYWSGVGTS